MTPSETAGSKVEPQAITLSENDHKTTQIKLEKPQERIDEKQVDCTQISHKLRLWVTARHLFRQQVRIYIITNWRAIGLQ
jgi:hypothetical protein